jgi:hypothetical protein
MTVFRTSGTKHRIIEAAWERSFESMKKTAVRVKTFSQKRFNAYEG